MTQIVRQTVTRRGEQRICLTVATPAAIFSTASYEAITRSASASPRMSGKKPKPTEAELAILQVLWQRGPSTVRDIHDALKKKRTAVYTTILKFLTIMDAKGLVTRNKSQRSHVYRALVEEPKVERQLIRQLLKMAFGGSPTRLAMRALAEELTDPDELELIRKQLDDLEKRGT